MIVATGVDIVEIERIRSSFKRWGPRFASKILCQQELEKLAAYKSGGAAYLARQFAGKEAVSKVLGTGMRAGVHFSQIQITRKDSGAPRVELTGNALKRSQELGILFWHITISDEKDYAIAYAIGEK